MTSLSTSHTRIAELDGVRAIAIWMVLALHIFYGYPTPPSALAALPRPVEELISHGWLGVDLFFVLSGFLITGILLDSKDRPKYFRNFYGRRALRILPLYLVTIFVMWLCYAKSTAFVLLSTVFMSNFVHAFHVWPPHGAAVLWSLAIEEHFYLLWPLLVLRLDRRALAVLSALIVLVTPALRYYGASRGMDLDHAVYCYSWFRFDGLALGALLALWVRSSYNTRRSSFILAGLLLAGSAVITIVGAPYGVNGKGVAGASLRYTQAQLPFAAFIVSVLTLRSTAATGILRSRFAALSGELSYCLYLIHLAIGDAYVFLLGRFDGKLQAALGGLGFVLTRGAAILVVSFALAMLSQRYLEGPFLRMKRFFETRGDADNRAPA